MKRHDAKSIFRCKYCDFEYWSPIRGTKAVSGLKRCMSKGRFPKGCKMKKVVGK